MKGHSSLLFISNTWSICLAPLYHALTDALGQADLSPMPPPHGGDQMTSFQLSYLSAVFQQAPLPMLSPAPRAL